MNDVHIKYIIKPNALQIEFYIYIYLNMIIYMK